MSVWNYLFSSAPEQFRYFWPLLVALSLLIYSCWLFQRKILPAQDRVYRQLLKDYPHQIAITAMIAIFFLGARVLGMRILSARIFLFALIGIIIYLLANAVYSVVKDYPRALAEKINAQHNTKYLPRKKKD